MAQDLDLKACQWTRERQTGRLWYRSVGAAKLTSRQDQVTRVQTEQGALEMCCVQDRRLVRAVMEGNVTGKGKTKHT